MKFCKKCGIALIKEDADGFDERTGKRNFELICPTRKCFHTGFETHDLDSHLESRGIFRDPWFVFLCKRCGHSGRHVLEPDYGM